MTVFPLHATIAVFLTIASSMSVILTVNVAFLTFAVMAMAVGTLGCLSGSHLDSCHTVLHKAGHHGEQGQVWLLLTSSQLLSEKLDNTSNSNKGKQSSVFFPHYGLIMSGDAQTKKN